MDTSVSDIEVLSHDAPDTKSALNRGLGSE